MQTCTPRSAVLLEGVEHAGVCGGIAGRTRNAFADCASSAFRFPAMCIRAFEAEGPRTLYSRFALLACCGSSLLGAKSPRGTQTTRASALQRPPGYLLSAFEVKTPYATSSHQRRAISVITNWPAIRFGARWWIGIPRPRIARMVAPTRAPEITMAQMVIARWDEIGMSSSCRDGSVLLYQRANQMQRTPSPIPVLKCWRTL
jgi:hypothetical protein